ncbi:DUF881 domain-containing protein [Candidatus Frankia alpina]|uniref:DUF881 domain-containing protein n=1 Tax=Candidatus Frankia alpina TaxID=2699483 RepID=UPI001F45C979|nr:DUF881 domain-containing protein [Candidatus Frankia alpina]
MAASAAASPRPEPVDVPPAEPVAAGVAPAQPVAGEPDAPGPADPASVGVGGAGDGAAGGGAGRRGVDEGDPESGVAGEESAARDVAAAEPGAGPGPVGMRLRRPVTLVLLAALGFAGVVAARSADPSFSLATASPDELAASLGAIGAQDHALATQEGRLRREADRAVTPGAPGTPGASSAAGGASGLAAERAQADELAILAGTVPVAGSGLELTIRDLHRAVDASVLVDALQELRDAGAEAIEIAGVRAVVSTYVADEPGHGLIVDGTSVAPPYVLRVVGDAHTLDQALRIPGGVLDTVAARDGAQAGVRTSGHLEIRALRPAPSPRYARPAG